MISKINGFYFDILPYYPINDNWQLVQYFPDKKIGYPFSNRVYQGLIKDFGLWGAVTYLAELNECEWEQFHLWEIFYGG